MIGRSPAATWLMLIDMQRIFGEPGSAWFTPGFGDAAAGAIRLRAAFAPHVALTRFLTPATPQGIWVRYYEQWPFARDAASAPLYDLMPAFPIEDAVVIDRTTFGKWDEAARDALPGVDGIILAGVSTDCCVLSTALAAADAGLRVRVAADACAGVDATCHQRALDVMALYAPHIEITTVDAILDAMG